MNSKKSLIVAGIALYVVGLFLYVLYDFQRLKSESMQALDDRLRAGATAVSAILGEEYHRGIPDRQPTDEEYMSTLRALSRYTEAAGLSYAYSMIERGKDVLFTSSSATAEELAKDKYSKFLDPYADASETARKSFRSKTPLFETYTDKWGSFRSIFLPMTSPDGKTFVIGTDISTTELDAASMRSLSRSLLTGGVFMLLLAPLAVILVRSAKDERHRLEEEINKQTREIKSLNESLEARVHEAEAEADKARAATEEARLAKAEAEDARRQGMLKAAEEIEGVVRHINGASDALSSRFDDVSRGAAGQRERTGETAVAVEQMSAAILETARNAGDAARQSEDARGKAQEGERVVRQAVEAIGRVRNLSSDLKQRMGDLSQRTQSIGHVMEIISDIADQTNLLALNAAIEAARAGDAGRGFAVVADEVRKLAEKTMAATKEVGTVIDAVCKGTEQSSQRMDEALGAVELATDLADRSGRALAEIVGLVDSATDQVRAIAASVEEQSAAAEQITKSVEDIRRVAEKTATEMTESGAALSNAASQARKLDGMVKAMRQG